MVWKHAEKSSDLQKEVGGKENRCTEYYQDIFGQMIKE